MSATQYLPVVTDLYVATGTAPIKPEARIEVDDDQAEAKGKTGSDAVAGSYELDGNTGNEPNAKKARIDDRDRPKRERGQNKNRRFKAITDEVKICRAFVNTGECDFGDKCKWSHDVETYLGTKGEDLKLVDPERYQDTAPFVSYKQIIICPNWDKKGSCKYGVKCRFEAGHQVESSSSRPQQESIHTTQPDTQKREQSAEVGVSREFLKWIKFNKRKMPLTSIYLREIEASDKIDKADEVDELRSGNVGLDQKGKDIDLVHADEPQSSNTPKKFDQIGSAQIKQGASHNLPPLNDVSSIDTPDVPLRSVEKKRLDWRGQLYLAPLTTTGNLPFRQLCVSQGADITCAEMGFCHSFLAGSAEEWSRARRAPEERTFGVQIAGNKPSIVVPTAEALAMQAQNLGGLDFVDLNCGCPIDLVCDTGAGSMLLDSPGRLGKILLGMNRVLGDIPCTIKMRTSVNHSTLLAHKLMPRAVKEWGVSAMTLHGRSRKARYSKKADWEYIRQCVEAVRQTEEDNDLPRTPFIGNGDVNSASEYYEHIRESNVDCVMFARGALIKPWVFREVKEQREIDISARERLDLVRQLAELGIHHWGSDTRGINTARRFLCEALSFQHRYVPIGLLEHLPSRMNDRPPIFKGRNELETLLASPDSADWVKISEMFLGPAPEQFSFIPKHKSNAFGGDREDNQG